MICLMQRKIWLAKCAINNVNNQHIWFINNSMMDTFANSRSCKIYLFKNKHIYQRSELQNMLFSQKWRSVDSQNHKIHWSFRGSWWIFIKSDLLTRLFYDLSTDLNRLHDLFANILKNSFCCMNNTTAEVEKIYVK